MVKTRLTRAATLIAASSLVLFGAAACGDDEGDNNSDGGTGSDATGKVVHHQLVRSDPEG